MLTVEASDLPAARAPFDRRFGDCTPPRRLTISDTRCGDILHPSKFRAIGYILARLHGKPLVPSKARMFSLELWRSALRLSLSVLEFCDLFDDSGFGVRSSQLNPSIMCTSRKLLTNVYY